MLKRSENKSKFQYKPRTSEQLNKRATQSGGLRDSPIKDEFQFFSPKGNMKLRILPPTWSDTPDHWGYDAYIHYQIGPDNAAYLCLNKMKSEDCPICQERLQAEKEGEADYAKSLAPTKRVFVWVIDRNNEDAGPLIWSMPWTVDRDICKLSIDDSGEIIYIDDPEKGYDVLVSREGEGVQTRYNGIQIARRTSPLGKDEWLEFVIKNPLSECLHYYDASYIKSIFIGKPKHEEEEEEEVNTHTGEITQKTKEKEPETASKPVPTTKDEVAALSDDELIELALDSGIEESALDSMSFEELVDDICKRLHIGEEKPQEAKLSYKDRIKSLRDKAK